MMNYSRQALLNLRYWWKFKPSTPRDIGRLECSSLLKPLSAEIWKTIDTLGIKRSSRGKRSGCRTFKCSSSTHRNDFLHIRRINQAGSNSLNIHNDGSGVLHNYHNIQCLLSDDRTKSPRANTRVISYQLTTFDPVSCDDVKRVILSAPPKSCSLDPLPTSLLRECIDVLVPYITVMANRSLTSGEFPSQLKHGLVTPLLKSSDADPNVLKNYRPITNLTFLGKTIERLAAKQLTYYLASNELHSKTQSAYRANHSTETAMLRVSNDINIALDYHNDVILVMLDLSSAFDTIDHSILLKRLFVRYGVSEIALSWIRSYLTDRTQSISINCCTSSPYDVAFGVPQGSVLGPLLFSLYAAPIEDIIITHGFQPMLYADDTQLYVVLQNADKSSCVTKIQSCVQEILDWMVANKLSCNSSKTDVLHFRSRYLPNDSVHSVDIGGKEIMTAHKVKDLGVTLDRHLKMTDHINNLCKSASFSLKRIGSIRKYLNQESTERLVHAFISSKLDYCNSLLYGLPGTAIDRLQRIQNSAARLVTRTKRTDHITPVLRKLHWLSVRKRIIFKINLLTYKVLNGVAPDYLSDLVTLQVPTRRLRSNANDNLRLYEPRCRTKNYGDRAYSICAPRLWNSLPLTVRCSESIDIFKKRLKTYLFNL